MAADTTLNIRDLLSRSADWLAGRGVASPRLDAEVLIAHALGLRRLDLYLYWDRPVDEDEKTACRELLRRRGKREPVAYVVGSREFFSLPLGVAAGVLIPRPETEILVEKAVALARERLESQSPPLRVADVGTGSGAVAVAFASEIADAEIVATDLSETALDVARSNAEMHGAAGRIRFVRTSLLEGEDGPFDLVLSNPPYVAERDRAMLAPDVLDYEPHEALFAGEDGLDVLRALIPEAGRRLRPGGWALVEVGKGQSDAVRALFAEDGRFENAGVQPDYAGVERVVFARRTAS